MRKVVLTGATSLLGIALIDECIANDVSVLVLARRDSKKLNRIPESPLIMIAECGLEDMRAFCYSAADFDVFYHFGWSHTDKNGRLIPSLQEENIRFSLDAVDLANRLGCRKFIGAGSQAEYGIHYGKSTSPSSPLCPRDAYGAAKAAAGKLCALEANRLGIQSVWVRIFSLYGKHESENTLIQTVLRQMLVNERCSLTPCLQKWDYLHSSDAGKAMLAIGEKSEGNKTYCMGSGQSRPLREFVEEIKVVIDSNSELGFGDIPCADSASIGFCADISSLTEDTGWKPSVPFFDGIAIEAERIRQQL